jgi:hypothetical protein
MTAQAETRLTSFDLFPSGMAQRTIRFRIRPDGRVEETVEGVAGQGCQQLTERIESRLGTVQQRQETSEAFQAGQRSAELQQPLSANQPVG